MKGRKRNKHTRNLKYNVDEDLFKDWNSESSWLLGYIYADGHVTKNDNLDFTSEVKDLLNKVKQALSSEHPIKERRGNYYINICSKEICDDLRELGLTSNKSDNLPNPPEEIVFSDFLRGVIDGDGCVSMDREWIRVDVTSNCRSFLEYLKDNIKDEFGIKNGQLVKNGSYLLRFGQREAIEIYKRTYKDSELYNVKKKNRFEELIDSKKQLTCKMWFDFEEEFLKNNYMNLEDSELGERLNRSAKAIESKRLKMGLKKRRSRN